MTDDRFPLKELPNHWPRRAGKKIAITTAWRWATTGVRGVKLRTELLGGVRFTSQAAIDEFVGALNGRPVRTAPSHRRRREAEIRAAERELDAAGI